MPKSRSRRDDNLRRHIAYIAARLMAEEGVDDYATAKSKAARQAGLGDAHQLPDNHEIEAALREYQGLYQAEDQPTHLRRLREAAVKAMTEFAPFRPVLVGAVLNGTATQFSEVQLHLFTDDAKSLTIYLVNHRYRFETGERRVRIADDWVDVEQMHIEVDGVPVTLSVYSLDDERIAPKPRGEADGPSRARLAEVQALLGS